MDEGTVCYTYQRYAITTLQDEGQWWARARVTEKEALSKATNPQALEMNFKGIFLDEGRRIISS